MITTSLSIFLIQRVLYKSKNTIVNGRHISIKRKGENERNGADEGRMINVFIEKSVVLFLCNHLVCLSNEDASGNRISYL